MVFNVTFNNISVISWPSVLLVAETGVHIAMYEIRNHNIVVRTGFLLQQQIIFWEMCKMQIGEHSYYFSVWYRIVRSSSNNIIICHLATEVHDSDLFILAL